MTNKNMVSSKNNIKLVFKLLAVLLILVLALSFASAAAPAAANAQPTLLAMAAQQPDTTVRVIIQKSDPAADVESLITDLGGEMIKEMHIINTLVAEMGVETAVDISFDASVNWISIDSPVEGAGKPPKNSVN